MKTHQQVIAQAANGNQYAEKFLLALVCIMHVWDDLIDKDKPVADELINQAFRTALVDLPRNLFYRNHFDELNALVSIAVTNWMIATAMERADEPDYQECAFIIRSSYVDLVTATATICGGAAHGVETGMEARKVAHREKFSGYVSNLINEKTMREGAKNVL